MSLPSTAAKTAPDVLLVVEDEELVRSYVLMVLQSAGHQVLEAKDGLEAVRVFEMQQARIQAVLLDLTLPRLKGVEVAARVRALNPKVPILFMSGSHDANLMTDPDHPGLTSFLPKPFRPDDLLKHVKRMIPG